MRQLLAARVGTTTSHAAASWRLLLLGRRRPDAHAPSWLVVPPFLPARAVTPRLVPPRPRGAVLLVRAAPEAGAAPASAAPATGAPPACPARPPPARLTEMDGTLAVELSMGNATGMQVLFLGTGCGPPTPTW